MTNVNDKPDNVAAWVIGPYLVIHIILLAYVGFWVWLSADWKQFLGLPYNPLSTDSFIGILSPQKFALFRQIAIAACSAGIGGAVFMIREFYINYAYGTEDNKGRLRYLKNREIPRYVLLPFSSIVLGPISIFLLQAGAIVFAGFSSQKNIPDYTIVTVSFLFGFAYHDSLRALRKLSRRMFSRSNDAQKEG